MSIPTPRWQRALLAVLVVVGLVVLYAGLYGCGDTETPRYAPSSGTPTAVAPTPETVVVR